MTRRAVDHEDGRPCGVENEMASGAGEPMAKRAKVDEAKEAKEEEDPLVRRREELILEVANARAEGTAKEDLRVVCATLEAKNEKLFRRLLPELWSKIVDEYLHQNDLPALAMTCRFFREKQKDLGRKVETNLTKKWLLDLQKSGKVTSHSLGWFQWVCDTFDILPGFKWPSKKIKGAVYEGNLLNYAALQGSVEILRWLMEEKGWELNFNTGFWAGWGGSVAVLEYLRAKDYKLGREAWACKGAARGGHLKALKYLRGLDPPCPWGWGTCSWAAWGGHLEVLKWARSQDPPCPWNEWTCSSAARNGHLEILKWVRSQDPPCPWSRSECRGRASRFRHQHIVQWIDQQED